MEMNAYSILHEDKVRRVFLLNSNKNLYTHIRSVVTEVCGQNSNAPFKLKVTNTGWIKVTIYYATMLLIFHTKVHFLGKVYVTS